MRGRVLLLVAMLSLSACTDSNDGTADPTVPTAAGTTATSATPDVSVIPQSIDEAYLNAVLAALDEVDGEATRIIVATKRFPPEAANLLNAIYSDERFQVQADAWFEALGEDPELGSIKAEPGNRRTEVQRIITASHSCVWMAVERDHSASSVTQSPPRTEYIALRPLDESNDRAGQNPTAWMITADGFNEDGSEPGNQCDAS